MEQKEQNKNPASSPKEAKPEQPLTPQQRQRRRKMLVYPLMGLLFAGSMWLIFAPSEKEKAEATQGMGFNTEMPLPAESGIIADKRAAYEQARMEEKQQERRSQMHDLASLFSDKEEEPQGGHDDFDLLNPEPEQPARSYGGGSRQTIRSSASAYQDINRTLGGFYEQPADDPEKEELRERVEELEAMMAQQAAPSGTSLDDQVALLEKSYELAMKYMPAGQNGTRQPSPASDDKSGKAQVRNGKAVAMPVQQVTTRVVSALAQPMSDAEFATAHGRERNYGFHTAIGSASTAEKNTIAACVHADQTITEGQAVRLRLLERMERASPATRLSWVRHGCRANASAWRSPRSNTWGRSFWSSLPCSTATDRRASSSRTRWRSARSRRLPLTWVRRSVRVSTSPPTRGRSSPPTSEKA